MDSLVAPEGVYTMNDEQKPPPALVNLPSTQQVYPTRLSSATVNFPNPKSSSPGFTALLGGTIKPKDQQRDKKGNSNPANGYDDSLSSSDRDPDEISDPPDPENQSNSVHPTPTSLFSPGPSDLSNKKKSTRRPKHNIRTTSSSFVTRLQSMENLNKHLSSKVGEVTFLFYNVAKSFFWTEAGSKLKDPLARITFATHPTCHSVNYATASHTTLDVIIGFSSGDLIWFDPLSSRYVRINKSGCITSSPCTGVHWVPSSRSLFVVSHADGTLIIYDREREDPSSTFIPRDPNALSPPFPPTLDPSFSSPHEGSPNVSGEGFREEWNPLEDILVTPGPSGPLAGGNAPSGKDRVLRNPISHWRVSKKSITSFAFAPNCRHVAVGSDDGYLRVIDALSERLEDSYSAYFGALTCVRWSPDGRFILAGGQDDLLTIFAPFEQRVVARCQGHSSFVSGVAFDTLKCTGRTYRFASVGEDNKLILWDFSGGALHRPKTQGHTARLSLSSTISLALRRREPSGSDMASLYQSTSPPPNGLSPPTGSRVHQAPSRNDVAVLQPVVAKQIEAPADLLVGVHYTPHGVFTISKGGVIKNWVRPLPINPRAGTLRRPSRYPVANGIGEGVHVLAS